MDSRRQECELEVFENQWRVRGRWQDAPPEGAASVLWRPAWSDEAGVDERIPTTLNPPPGFEWVTDWRPSIQPTSDEQGWKYGPDWHFIRHTGGDKESNSAWSQAVRRRRYYRIAEQRASAPQAAGATDAAARGRVDRTRLRDTKPPRLSAAREVPHIQQNLNNLQRKVSRLSSSRVRVNQLPVACAYDSVPPSHAQQWTCPRDGTSFLQDPNRFRSCVELAAATATKLSRAQELVQSRLQTGAASREAVRLQKQLQQQQHEFHRLFDRLQQEMMRVPPEPEETEPSRTSRPAPTRPPLVPSTPSAAPAPSPAAPPATSPPARTPQSTQPQQGARQDDELQGKQQQQQQLQLTGEDAGRLRYDMALYEALALEREQQATAITQEAVELHGVMRDLAHLVNEQRDDVETVVTSTEAARVHAERGTRKLEEANRLHEESTPCVIQ